MGFAMEVSSCLKGTPWQAPPLTQENKMLRLDFNVSVSGFGAFEPIPSRSLRRRQRWLQLSQLPLLTSFFKRPNAVDNQNQTKYSKDNSIGQWQIFEEVTGKTNAGNIFAQVTVDFCNKFINFLFVSVYGHKFLSIDSVSERQVWGCCGE
jgi:hypothetical protein